MDNVFHVVPANDLIEHDTDGETCECEPRTEVVETKAGDARLIVHNSADGRELSEVD